MRLLGRKLQQPDFIGRKLRKARILGKKMSRHSHHFPMFPANDEFIRHDKSDLEKNEHISPLEYRPHRDHIKGVGIHNTIPENPANMITHRGVHRSAHCRAHHH